ncbi:MAG TPA: c-type cytochrome [Caulobacteraceae bacterium]|jgi:cytochrome c553
MSEDRHDAAPRVLDQPWRIWASVIVAGALGLAALGGFIILPIVQGGQAGLDPWTAICRAVGLTPGTPAQPQPPNTGVSQPVSRVSWSGPVLGTLAHGDRRSGAQIAAAVCSSCHGEEGISPSAEYPHLAGQSAAAIYKQLNDYKTGARVHPLMTPVAQKLTDRQLADVAAYFAGDNAFGSLGPRWPVPDEATEQLVQRGDPHRGIPACNACHGSAVGGPIETPTLVGQHADYLDRQLAAFGTGARRNDVYRRMRMVSARLTPEERKRLANYYQGLR